MKNLAGLMKSATQMQARMEEMQARLEATELTGEAGAGMVKITMNGKNELRRIQIDPQLANPAEMEMLEDLIQAAHRDARPKIEAFASEEMQKVTGGMQLPPGMKFPF